MHLSFLAQVSRNSIIRTIFVAAVLVTSMLLPLGAHAQQDGNSGTPPKFNNPGTPPQLGNPGTPPQVNGPSGGLVNPLKNISSLDQFLLAILDAVIYLGGIVLVLMLVYTGFLFVVARGNEEKISGARTALFWTVIGGLILLGAKSIMLVIQGTVSSL